MERKIEFEKVVQALKLCGPDFRATSCDECPYRKHCVQHGATPLLEDATALLLDMREDLLTFKKAIEQIQEGAAVTNSRAVALCDNAHRNGFLHGWLRFEPQEGADE